MVASVEYFSHLHFVHQSFVRRQNQIQYVFTPLPCCLFNMLLQKSVVHHVYKLPIFFPLTFHFLPVDVIVEVPIITIVSLLAFSIISHNPSSTSSFAEGGLQQTPINILAFPVWISHHTHSLNLSLQISFLCTAVILFLTYSSTPPPSPPFFFFFFFFFFFLLIQYPSRASSLSAISSFAHVSINPIMSGSSLSTYNSNSILFSISIILLTLA